MSKKPRNTKSKSTEGQRDFIRWAEKQPLWDPRKGKERPPFNPADHPVQYRRVLCTFADVLGFQSMISASTGDAEQRSKIRFILDSFRRSYHSKGSSGDEVHTEPRVVLRNFSDLILRIAPLSDRKLKDGSVAPVDLCSEIVHEAIDLCGAQFGLLKDGILVRGGMTVGDLYWDDNHVFGPALVRAYELERDLAHYPRIVIDAEMVQCVKADPKRSPFLDSFWSPCFRQDFDGMWFADYLNLYVAFSRPKNIFIRDGYRKPFDHFREFILQQLLDAGQKTSSLSSKYLWLAKYFNDVVEHSPEGSGVDWKELSIPLNGRN